MKSEEKKHTGPLVKKVAAILAEAGLGESCANGIAGRRFGVQSYRRLDREQLWQLLAALSIYRKRRTNRNPQSGPAQICIICGGSDHNKEKRR